MSSIIDALFAAVAFIAFGMVVIVGFTVYSGIASSGLFGSYQGSFDGFWASINNVALFIVVGMAMAAVLSSYMIGSHPAFFFVSVILIFIQALIVPSLVNTFNTVAGSSAMAGALNEFNLLIPLIDNLPLITIITSLIAAVLGLMRSRG
jgi:hypothetical protein